MPRSTSTGKRSTETVSMHTCVSSCCGSIRRSGARSNKYRSRPMRRRTVRAGAIAIAAIVALTADRASAAEFARDEAVRVENKTVAVKGTPTVVIDNQNGTLRIKTHPRPEVRIDAVFRVSAESRDVANE